jgi:pyruvate/2-oxoglutarate dehydrogenase complex dihydrolipoamide acyltransferase (E2) component
MAGCAMPISTPSWPTTPAAAFRARGEGRGRDDQGHRPAPRIAENMAASKRHIPHFSYVEECDVTALETLRAQLNAGAGRPAQADHAAAADHRDLPRAARFSR